jgi:hypothetical protein
MSCDYGQGFLFSPPLNEETATIWLTEMVANLEHDGNHTMHNQILKSEWYTPYRNRNVS